MIDIALRRRFAFVNLRPLFEQEWHNFVKNNVDIEDSYLNIIQENIKELNKSIASDENLGEQYQIGHSYLTPSIIESGVDKLNGINWYRDVVESEIVPLLEEYWFDNVAKASDCEFALLKGIPDVG
jgi:5-methylcytosine-specific restriction protein B